MSLRYLVELEMLIVHVLRTIVTKRNSRIYPTATVVCKFATFESMWEIFQEKVYKTLITDLELLTTPLMSAAAMTT